MPLDAAKRNMQQLFRQLIAMTQTLAPLPEDKSKILSIRLFFTESTPDDYQPPGFRAASKLEAARFVTHYENDRPHDQQIGTLNTGHHACTIKITTICDLEEHADRSRDVRLWDAEHNAKHACKVNNPHVEYAPSTFQVPPSFEDVLMRPGQQTTDQEMVLVEETPSQATQALTQYSALHKSEYMDDPRHQQSMTAPSVFREEPGFSVRPESVEAIDISYDKLSLESTPKVHEKSLNFNDLRTCTPCSTMENEQAAEKVAEVVTCECGDQSEDGIMVECDNCHGWSHLPCYVTNYLIC